MMLTPWQTMIKNSVYCNKSVKSESKCINCNSAHPTCTKRLKDVKFRDGGMICCSGYEPGGVV